MKTLLRFSVLLATLLLMTGCGNDAIVNIYDRKALEAPLPCLRLDLAPSESAMRTTMEALHPFSSDRSCPYRLSVSGKGGIHCNSNANAPRKTLSNFPSAYLRMELHKGMRLLYSYYIDLTHPVEPSDLREAFERLRKDVKLPAASR